MRKKKLLKVLGISLASVTIILFLFVGVFIFNPFEGSLPDMRFVVPRNVDFFVRKTLMVDDFDHFPEPHFWRELSEQPDWRKIEAGPTYRSINGHGEVTRMLQEVRDRIQQVRSESSGYLDPFRDILGTEVIVAGRLSQPTEWCLYARVGWSAKAAWGLAGYGFVQDQLKQNGLTLRDDGDGLFAIDSSEAGQTFYAARHLDCLMFGNSRPMVLRSYQLATGVGDPDSFGGSSSYQDGIENRLRAWEDKTHEVANALEFYLRPPRLFQLPGVTLADEWPNPNDPNDMNSRVMASFIKLHSWLFLTGSLIFEPDSFSLLADVELNQNEHTPFQAQFFKTESQQRREWLDPFLAMVPASACACAGMRMPAGDFLREMFAALEPDLQQLLDEGLTATGKYQNTLDLISQLELVLRPRTGFVFRKNVPDPQIPVADRSPVPAVAWVFWLRQGGEDVVRKLITTMTDYRQAMKFENVFDLSLGLGAGGVGGDAAREFTNAQIPGTGEIATLIYPPFFVLSNSGPFIREMMRTLLGDRPSVRSKDEFIEFSAELPDAVNAFVYVQGPQLEELLNDYLRDIEAMSTIMDAVWARDHRGTAETTVLNRSYARYRTVAGIPRSVRPEFDAAVDKELEAMWQSARSRYTADSRGAVVEAMGLARLFRAAYVQMILEPRHMRLQGRALASFR